MKLGCLPYLNVKPLVQTLEDGGLPDGWEFVYAPPSQLAGMLEREEIAAAPVSSYAVFANPDFDICPGICIAADGPVKSVLMLSEKPVEDIQSVALDTSSLSGANMLKILLDELHGLQPEFVRVSPDPVSGMLEKADAAMVIGDPAMQCAKDGLYVFDLAEKWRELTGLPAVFAVWTGKGITAEVVEVLQGAKENGMRLLDDIARDAAERLALPLEVCDDYLKNVMVYDLGEREMLGLKMFRDKCLEHGLLPERVEITQAAVR